LAIEYFNEGDRRRAAGTAVQALDNRLFALAGGETRRGIFRNISDTKSALEVFLRRGLLVTKDELGEIEVNKIFDLMQAFPKFAHPPRKDSGSIILLVRRLLRANPIPIVSDD
jgi:hypothetical protein